MSKYMSRGLAVFSMFLLLMVFTLVPALAFDLRGGKTVIVAAGEVVDDDLYVGAQSVIIDGTVNGDLWAVGRTVTVNGLIKGSVVAVGETVDINGDVGHAVRVGGRTLNISGNVDGDVVVGGSEVNVASIAKIGGSLLLGAEDARIDGIVEGKIKGAGGEVTIGNGVKGDVKLKVERLILLPTANIQGNLTYTSEEEADIRSGAQIGGEIIHKLPEVKYCCYGLFHGIAGKIMGFLMALITGLVIILLAPKWMASLAESIRTKPWPSVGWGAVILCVTPIAAVIVCITIVGIPLGLIALALYGIAIYFAQIPVGLFIGRWIIGYFRKVEGKAIMVGALALGLLIIGLLGLIPYLGDFIWLAVILFGLGAIVVSERRRRAEARKVTSP